MQWRHFRSICTCIMYHTEITYMLTVIGDMMFTLIDDLNDRSCKLL